MTTAWMQMRICTCTHKESGHNPFCERCDCKDFKSRYEHELEAERDALRAEVEIIKKSWDEDDLRHYEYIHELRAEVEKLKAEMETHRNCAKVWEEGEAKLNAELYEARQAIKQALNCLGTGLCKVNKCEGCHVDVEMAIDELKVALEPKTPSSPESPH